MVGELLRMEQQMQSLESTPAVAPGSLVVNEIVPVQSDPVVTPLTEEELEALTSFLHIEARRARWLSWVRNGVIGLALAGIVLLWFFWDSIKRPTLYILPYHLFNLCLGFVANRFKSKRHKHAVEALTKSNDVRVIGPLTEVFALPHKEMKNLAADALVVLLPKLRATDATLLSNQHRDLLRPRLKEDNKALILAILRAYEQIGDERDLPAVEALADGKGKLAMDEEVRTAVSECYPFLLANAKRHQVSQTLLRAAEHPPTKAEELLRPAQSSDKVDPQQLLRPSDEA